MAVYDFGSGSQSQTQIGENGLNAEDRRLWLGSTLRYLACRYGCGQPVLRRELLLLEHLADDAKGSGEDRA